LHLEILTKIAPEFGQEGLGVVSGLRKHGAGVRASAHVHATTPPPPWYTHAHILTQTGADAGLVQVPVHVMD
jgi:hypothetical protein